MKPEIIRKSATISDCGKYRYDLRRVWDDNNRQVLWIMLNPSTADADQDDNTITRCIRFSQEWGYGGLVVVNLFALRATYPSELKRHQDPIGPNNDEYLAKWAGKARFVVAAWGANGVYKERGREVMKRLIKYDFKIHCLKVTKNGQPGHPVRLKADTEAIPYTT